VRVWIEVEGPFSRVSMQEEIPVYGGTGTVECIQVLDKAYRQVKAHLEATLPVERRPVAVPVTFPVVHFMAFDGKEPECDSPRPWRTTPSVFETTCVPCLRNLVIGGGSEDRGDSGGRV
jgi:hypothetical protein